MILFHKNLALLCSIIFGIVLLTWFIPAQGQDKPIREPDVIYVPTPYQVVDKMLSMADVRKGEIVYDLGCGDGRIPIMASKKFGVKSFGWDIDPKRVAESQDNIASNNIKDLVTITKGDIFELDLSK